MTAVKRTNERNRGMTIIGATKPLKMHAGCSDLAESVELIPGNVSMVIASDGKRKDEAEAFLIALLE